MSRFHYLLDPNGDDLRSIVRDDGSLVADFSSGERRSLRLESNLDRTRLIAISADGVERDRSNHPESAVRWFADGGLSDENVGTLLDVLARDSVVRRLTSTGTDPRSALVAAAHPLLRYLARHHGEVAAPTSIPSAVAPVFRTGDPRHAASELLGRPAGRLLARHLPAAIVTSEGTVGSLGITIAQMASTLADEQIATFLQCWANRGGSRNPLWARSRGTMTEVRTLLSPLSTNTFRRLVNDLGYHNDPKSWVACMIEAVAAGVSIDLDGIRSIDACVADWVHHRTNEALGRPAMRVVKRPFDSMNGIQPAKGLTLRLPVTRAEFSYLGAKMSNCLGSLVGPHGPDTIIVAIDGARPVQAIQVNSMGVVQQWLGQHNRDVPDRDKARIVPSLRRYGIRLA